MTDQRQFDGRPNFSADDHVEGLIDEHFSRFGVSKREITRNFQIYARRVFLKRFLAHYELFRKTVSLPGDIVELGVYRGLSLMSWANFLEIRSMGDRAKQVFGFDNWAGFKHFEDEDGAQDERFNKVLGGFDGGVFRDILADVIRIFDCDRFIPYKPRVRLIDGDIEVTVPRFVEENPGLRISLIHFDCDLYRPTKIGLSHLWPRVVSGGIVVFDEFGIRPWEGESTAVDEFFAERDVKIRRFDWSHIPGGYIIK